MDTNLNLDPIIMSDVLEKVLLTARGQGNNTMTKKIPNTPENWESGKLGQDENHVKTVSLSKEQEQQIDEAAELQMISIRLRKDLIEKFKFIASKNGIGYQPLMKQALTRFADCEIKQIIRQEAVSQASTQDEHEDEDDHQKLAL